MYLVVGLGNPGLKYKYTRHNAGFMAIEALADKIKAKFIKKRFEGITAEASIKGEKVLLLKPYTFMNLSGDAVRAAADFYKIPAENIIIIYDDIDIELGSLRIRAKGSAGTHNGMRSIIARLGTGDFPRVRIGIGKKPVYYELKDFVLAKLKKDDKAKMLKAAEDAADAVRIIIEKGIAEAQGKYN